MSLYRELSKVLTISVLRSTSPRKVKVEDEPSPIKQEFWWEQPGAMASVTSSPTKEPQAERPSPRSRKMRFGSSGSSRGGGGPPSVLQNFMCLDCEVCSEDCDHEDHTLTVRQGDMAQHVLTTGHRYGRNTYNGGFFCWGGNQWFRLVGKLLVADWGLFQTMFERSGKGLCRIL